ncbi:MAG TPA: secretion system protein E [Rhodospirillaceae bacterium]|nr:MAG: secretion system protein E [Alphaproteobacteria bacterium GWF2_58_20]HAU29504.1 secretion system protein E [Rhodospirillaceae bacterium]
MVIEPRLKDHQRLGDYLVERGLVDREAIEAAVREGRITGERIGNILVRNGFLRYADLIKAILSLSPEEIVFEKSYGVKIPREMLERYSIVVVAETDLEVYLSTLSAEETVRVLIQPYFPNKELVFVSLSPTDLSNFMESLGREGEDQNFETATDDALVLDMLLRQAILVGASDIHIEPRFRSFTVFFRHLGIRKIAHEGSLEQFAIMASQVKDRARMDQVETRVPQDGGFTMEFRGRMVDMRVATVPSVNGEIIVIRLLDPDKAMKTVSELGITRIDAWRAATSYPFGLCLICGSTGSGKTTTLNATVREMDRFGRAIRTVEDPVEYRIPYVGQVNVNPIVGLDFAAALRAFMRADPDVIVLGEVRDVETAKLCIRAAETGHMVLATLHTGSVRGAISRMHSLGISESDMKPILRGVLVQRLVRTICVVCGGSGCEDCFHTGYSGRTVVSECAMFKNDMEVDKALAGERWWPSMVGDAISKIKTGLTTNSEIYRCFRSEIDNYDQELEGIEELVGEVAEAGNEGAPSIPVKET